MPRVPFVTHFNEIKLRFFFYSLSFFSCFCVSFLDPTSTVFIFIKPLWVELQGPFLFTHPLEGIHASLLAQGFIGFLYSLPFLIYHFWCFMSSSLFLYEKKALSSLLLLFSIIFVLGFSLFYLVLLPLLCKFLLGYSSWFAVLEPRVLDYLLFFIRVLGGLLFFLLTPFVLFFICVQLGKEPRGVEGLRSWVFVFCILMGGLLSPPEVTTQMLVGLGLYFWYEILVLSLWVYWINLKSKK